MHFSCMCILKINELKPQSLKQRNQQRQVKKKKNQVNCDFIQIPH